MVAIKIQSLEDIVKAYLENLGFSGMNLSCGVEQLMAEQSANFNHDDVLSSLDQLVSKAAAKVFKSKELDKEQKLALFKLCYLRCSGAEKWDVQLLWGEGISDEILDCLRQQEIKIVPPYKMSQMLPQKIETMQPQNLFSKLFTLKGKK